LGVIAKIAVSAAVFAIDKPYSYRIPASLAVRAGMRVTVPFGKGNKKCEGIVLMTQEGDESRLKAVERALDDEPVLTDDQLRLAAFLRERYFCTYYDAVKAILPAGLWFETTETYTLCGEWKNLSIRQPAALQILQIVEDFGGTADYHHLKEQLPDEARLEGGLRYLLGKKLLRSDLDAAARVSGKTEKLASLAASCDDAAEFARRKQKSAPLQTAVLELLLSVGSASCREILYMTGASMTTLRRLEKLGFVAISEREVYRSPIELPAEPAGMPELTDEQQAAFDGLMAQAREQTPGVALLYGVTGSGKTAVYIRLIYAALAAGKSAVLLVPEIALTPQLLGRLTAHFGDQVAVLHSSLRVGERFDEWRRLREGKARVAVGTRSAVFAPVQNPGLFIVDEEQEHTYKSENAPRYHAREVAILRGARAGALVLLGSATPSVESMYRAKTGVYRLYTLAERYNGRALPRVQLVDMKQEIRRGNPTSVSGELEERLRDNILAKKQSILFLNRRGNSRCLVCVDCGEVPTCPRCSVHLTYHSVNNRLMCHYCGYSEPAVTRCPKCGGPMKQVGSGTQKIQEELAALFPDTRVLRMDADTVASGGGHEAILREFQEKQVPILLGTQMVAKGLNFDNVTLVGVLDADLSLYVDNYRAAETTFSLLTQVVGRSGRGDAAGIALIQTMTPEHPVMKLAARQDYDGFYEQEIRLRELRGCPPFGDLFTITFTGLFEEQVLRCAALFRDALLARLRAGGFAAQLLGPAPASVARVNYTYRYRLTLDCKNTRELRTLLAAMLAEFARDKRSKGVGAFADVNSYE
jgi:primosomal protein N' (replication factor Y) (superfamily II helicase)